MQSNMKEWLVVIFTLACTEKETKRARKYEHTVYILTSLLLSHHLKEKCAVQYLDSKKKTKSIEQFSDSMYQRYV